MHRVLLRGAASVPRSLRPCCPTPRSLSSAAASTSASAPSTSDARTPEPAAYSLPQDAFADDLAAPSSSASSSSAAHPGLSHRPSGYRPSASKPRQRQFLSQAETQAFADLLGEILPRSHRASPSSSSAAGNDDPANHPPGLFDIFSPSAAAAAAAQSPEVASSVTRVQQALLRSAGVSPTPTAAAAAETVRNRWERRTRLELTERESLELDRLREQLATLRSDKEVLEWGMRHVFGLRPPQAAASAAAADGDARVGILPDPTTLPVELPPSEGEAPSGHQPLARGGGGPASRLFPDLLLQLFITLRDAHRAPHAALSVFHLAAAHPYSYITGCTTALYNEVLRTRWAEGDVEALLAGLEEMRAAGVPLDDRTRDLVAAVGQAMRGDADRAEARVDALLRSGQLTPIPATPDDRDREVARRRFFSPHQIAAWGRMERIVEENLGELERERRERDDERWHAQERARLGREEGEYEQMERERPSLVGGGGGDRRRDGSEKTYRTSSSSSTPRHSSPYEDAAPPPRRRSPSGGGDGDWPDPVPERDEYGRPTLPKRPSFANPYKIRRKTMTRAEKSARDVPHPALWWKK